jgi:hypothetical protein
MGLVRFAGITRLDETVMHCSFALPKPLRSPRLHKVEEIVPGWWIHHLRVKSPDELDEQVQGWIRRSYRVMGMRERLRVPSRARDSRVRRGDNVKS